GVYKSVINLVEERRDWISVLILQRDLCLSAKRHRKITVKAPVRSDRDGNGIDDTFPPETTAEEVAQRRLHRRRFLSVPVHPEDQIPQHKTIGIAGLIIHRDPDML